MDTLQIVLIIAVVAIAAVAIAYYVRSRRSQRLRTSFGREYDRLVTETGNRTQAERELAARQRRIQKLELHPLSAEQREQFANKWRDEQEWPLARAKPTAFYLHSSGSANTLSGDGTLSTTPPAEEPADRGGGGGKIDAHAAHGVVGARRHLHRLLRDVDAEIEELPVQLGQALVDEVRWLV